MSERTQPADSGVAQNTATATDATATLRRSVYALLILVSTGAMLGRILAVDAVDKIGLEQYRLDKIDGDLAKKQRTLESQGVSGEALKQQLDQAKGRMLRGARLTRPFLSANDRSRWCTVRAIVEPEMRMPGAPYAIDRVIQEPNWDTIDMVKHDGHLYSSKPPLMATMMAAVYWPIHRLTGATLATRPYEIGRAMLVLFNVVPCIVYFVLLASLVERFGTTDWGRIFVMAAACFGTFLTTFAVTINNHVPAAVCVAATVFMTVRIWFDGERRLGWFALTGLVTALAVTEEYPAAALAAAVAIVLLLKAAKPTLLGFLPAAIVVAVAFLGTNWIAHGTLKPAYSMRGGSGPDNWYNYTYERNGRTVPSYWNEPKGLDRGEPSPKMYAANVLVGHHGLLSLTPVWLLSLVGLGLWMFRRGDPRIRWSAAAFAGIWGVVIAFYLAWPGVSHNYGGLTCGFRWLFWLAPLWLLAMLPAADLLAPRRWTRGLALVLLALSVLSASYPTWNPWTNPWLMVFSQYLGWH
ncbi:MAG: hypothetical protein ABFC63_05865 [Thermoguttaceae bacterium]